MRPEPKRVPKVLLPHNVAMVVSCQLSPATHYCPLMPSNSWRRRHPAAPHLYNIIATCHTKSKYYRQHSQQQKISTNCDFDGECCADLLAFIVVINLLVFSDKPREAWSFLASHFSVSNLELNRSIMTNSGHNAIPDAGDAGAGSGGGNTSIDRVEWSRTTILEFIEDYRGFNVLWDPNTKGYHIKQVKYEALKNLSRKYSTEVRVIRSKIKSLRSSFHREHGKVISGKRRGVNYQPMWFAYEAIRFILEGERNELGGGSNSSFDAVCGIAGREHGVAGDVYNNAVAVGGGGVSGGDGACLVSNGIDANDELVTFLKTDQTNEPHYANISAGDVKTEILETSNAELENMSRSEKSKYKKSLTVKSKRRRSAKNNNLATHQVRSDSDSDSLASSSCKKMRKINASDESDEFGVFGEYVGITIRRLKTSKAQVVIKHLINNLLFDAEMGRYDYGIPTSREPPHLYATTD